MHSWKQSIYLLAYKNLCESALTGTIKKVRILIIRILTFLGSKDIPKDSEKGVYIGMREKNLKEVYQGLMEFNALFHQKFGHVFRSSSHSEYSCTKSQNKALMIVGKKGRMTSTMLGQCLDMKKGSLTTMIDSLEEMGLIFRQSDETDRRKTWIDLTNQGKKYMDAKMKEFEKSIIAMFSNLGEDEIEDFAVNVKAAVEMMKKFKE
ncbi:MAG: MarR family transcriptional regulator [Geosporobacter ferrireducens]|nr:MarR family transcriptional regulator [Geosporobacter ferrireducens]